MRGHSTQHAPRSERDQRGIALISAMLILVLVATLAISTMETTSRDQQVAGIQARSRAALQAAEAGLAATLPSVGPGMPDLDSAVFGDQDLYGENRPSYEPDPKVADPIRSLGALPIPGMSLNINGNGPKFQLQLWRINVQGTEPGGMSARVEAGVAAIWGE